MNWLYSFSTTEFLFVSLFVAFYSLYGWRTFRLARQLNTTAWGVVPKLFLRMIYLSLLLISLLGPSFGEGTDTIAPSTRDVCLVVDVSRSMDASDVVPTRLERTKYDIQQLCDTLPNDRFALILAANEPIVLSPLTADHDALQQFVREIRTNVSSTGGTNLCDALELARQKLLTDSSAREHGKAIVLFSDGENFVSCERATSVRLRSDRISLMAVGVGTEAGGAIREGRDFVRDANRQIIRTRLNRTFLQGLARDARGQYVEAGNQYINELVGMIRAVRGRSADPYRVAVVTNKYHYFLLGALALILLDLLIVLRTFRL